MPSITQLCWHVARSGHTVAFGGLPQSPHPRAVLSRWCTQCDRASSTTAVLLVLHPPALVHSDVVSLGCTSGDMVPTLWAAATPRRAAMTGRARGAMVTDKECRSLGLAVGDDSQTALTAPDSGWGAFK